MELVFEDTHILLIVYAHIKNNEVCRQATETCVLQTKREEERNTELYNKKKYVGIHQTGKKKSLLNDSNRFCI